MCRLFINSSDLALAKHKKEPLECTSWHTREESTKYASQHHVTTYSTVPKMTWQPKKKKNDHHLTTNMMEQTSTNEQTVTDDPGLGGPSGESVMS